MILFRLRPVADTHFRATADTHFRVRNTDTRNTDTDTHCHAHALARALALAVTAALAAAALAPAPAAANTPTPANPAADRAARTVLLGAAGERNLRIATVVATETTWVDTTFALGRLQADPARTSVVASRVPGRVRSLSVQSGEWVEAGAVVALVESRQPGPDPVTVTLRAQQAGTVLEVGVRPGDPVEPDQPLVVLADLTTLRAIARVPEDDLPALGDTPRGHAVVPAAGRDERPLQWHDWEPAADAQTGTVGAVFMVANPDGRLRPGLRVEFHLERGRRNGVLVVPRAAVQGDAANPVVFLRDFELPHAFVRQPVVVGARSPSRIEILAGLFPGDEVVTEGAYALQFIGPGSGRSLKEALDEAHGHAHAEDGSELPAGGGAATGSHDHAHHDHDDAHDHEPARWPLILLGIYAAAVTLALAWVAGRRRNTGGDAPC